MKREIFSWFLLFSLSLFLLAKLFFLQVVTGKEQVNRAEQNRFRIKVIEAERGNILDRGGNFLTENSERVRKYIYGKELAHVIGYLGEADSKEMAMFSVELGRQIGKMGLERAKNGILKGVDGGMVEEYGASGEMIRVFSKKEASKGRNLILTIDKDLQSLAYQLLEKEDLAGAIVISKIDGEILALVSYPSFDPNYFIEGNSEEIGKIFSDGRQMLFNRAIGGLYAPASIFKIVGAFGALEEEKIDRNFLVEDTGRIEVGGSTFNNWYWTSYGKTDGQVDIVKGLARSNDIFFYKIGEILGIEKLAWWAKKFGFGQMTGIEIEGEEKGLVPDEQWKKEILGEDWYLGDSFITAIGQGNLQVTPIQVNQMMSLVASDGYLCKPLLVGEIADEKYSLQNKIEWGNCKKMEIKKENLELVKQGLRGVCESGGTAWPFFDFGILEEGIEGTASARIKKIAVAGKTGTAETGKYETNKEGQSVQRLDAWFSGFVPYEKPEIVVTVILENGGQGSDKPALITREIMKRWLELRTKN